MKRYILDRVLIIFIGICIIVAIHKILIPVAAVILGIFFIIFLLIQCWRVIVLPLDIICGPKYKVAYFSTQFNMTDYDIIKGKEYWCWKFYSGKNNKFELINFNNSEDVNIIDITDSKMSLKYYRFSKILLEWNVMIDTASWNYIESEKDIDLLNKTTSFFHDSCIKEIHYISGAYVDDNFGMYPVNSKRTLKMIVQRQYKNNSVIEIEFIGLKQMNLVPTGEDYTCEIFGATTLLKNGYIYWCDDNVENIEEYQYTRVIAEKMRWRSIENSLGEKQLFVAEYDK